MAGRHQVFGLERRAHVLSDLQLAGVTAQQVLHFGSQLLVARVQDHGPFFLRHEITGKPHRLQHLLDGARGAAICAAGQQDEIGAGAYDAVHLAVRRTVVGEVERIHDAAVGRFGQPAGALQRDVRQQADDHGLDCRSR